MVKNYNEYEFDLYIESIESLKIENFNFAGPTILMIMNENQMLAVKIESTTHTLSHVA